MLWVRIQVTSILRCLQAKPRNHVHVITTSPVGVENQPYSVWLGALSLTWAASARLGELSWEPRSQERVKGLSQHPPVSAGCAVCEAAVKYWE